MLHFCKRWSGLIAGTLLLMALCATPAFSQDDAAVAPTADATTTETTITETTITDSAPAAAGPTTAELKVIADTLWVLIAGMLVFFMNLGFGCVESGMCREKNCVNILSKNFIVFAVSSIGFWLIGWGLMFGSGNDYVGTSGLWMVSGADNSPATLEAYQGDYGALNWTGVPLWAKFFFQLVFCGTAATIVSGAVAERIKYISFIIFSFVMAIAIYPVVGHWVWGGGWLQARGFLDFAGSTQVHSIGGWAALVGVIILGPRIGKYSSSGKPTAIPGHSMSLATIGCFVLWFGWFGFNPGSTMGAAPADIAEILVTTNSAAAAGTLSATLVAWLLLGKPDIGMTLNGCLAGLVAITAPCAFVTVPVSVLIGLIAGALVVVGVLFFDRVKCDDPVGATSVHLLNGVFGTLCIGLFATPDRLARAGNPAAKAGLFYGGGVEQLMTQLTGVVACAVYVVVLSLVAWLVLKMTLGIRVSPEEEREGLDIGEHGNSAYPNFVKAEPY